MIVDSFMLRELNVVVLSDLISVLKFLSFLFIVVSSFFCCFIPGANFVAGAYFLEVFIIEFFERIDFIIFFIPHWWNIFIVLQDLKWQGLNLLLKFCFHFCILLGNALFKFCILFDIVIIKTCNCFFNCSGKVSLVQIRRGWSMKCGGFSIDGSVCSGSGACAGWWRQSEEYILVWAYIMLWKFDEYQKLIECYCYL